MRDYIVASNTYIGHWVQCRYHKANINLNGTCRLYPRLILGGLTFNTTFGIEARSPRAPFVCSLWSDSKTSQVLVCSCAFVLFDGSPSDQPARSIPGRIVTWHGLLPTTINSPGVAFLCLFCIFLILTLPMCHGHPRYHPCSHSSVHWYYCPSALIDLSTGAETPCSNVSFAPSQRTTSDCPLLHCRFQDKNGGGGWTCCACNQGPNTRGWCTMPLNRWRRNVCTFAMEEVETTCDHGCCGKCTEAGQTGLMDAQRRMLTESDRTTTKPSV
jgi:hypothetical protein